VSDKQLYVIAHRPTEHPNPIDRRAGVDSWIRPADFHKIGIADDPEKRLSSMKSATPHTLEIVTTVDCENARDVESRLHSIFHLAHHSGEWFRLSTNDINSLEGLDTLKTKDLEGISGGIWGEGGPSLYTRIMDNREVKNE